MLFLFVFTFFPVDGFALIMIDGFTLLIFFGSTFFGVIISAFTSLEHVEEEGISHSSGLSGSLGDATSSQAQYQEGLNLHGYFSDIESHCSDF